MREITGKLPDFKATNYHQLMSQVLFPLPSSVKVRHCSLGDMTPVFRRSKALGVLEGFGGLACCELGFRAGPVGPLVDMRLTC